MRKLNVSRRKNSQTIFNPQIGLRSFFVASDTGKFHEQFAPPHGGGMEFIMNDTFFKLGILPAILLAATILLEPPGVSVPSLAAAAIHEGGHLLAAKALKIELHSLSLNPIGATIHTRGALISYKKEWLLCFAGPCANLLSCGIAYILNDNSEAAYGTAAFNFFAVSFMLAILNLLPIESFDGGRMMYCTIGNFFGPRVGFAVLRACSIISVCGLWMLSVYLLMRWGTSMSLLVFSSSVFCRIFICSEK